jgi:hypothetical protein
MQEGQGFQKDLLMYYLSGVGGALGGKGSWQESLGGMTQQQIQSEKYMGFLKQMLSGMPAGGKMTGDRDNIVMKFPTGTLGGPKDMTLGGGDEAIKSLENSTGTPSAPSSSGLQPTPQLTTGGVNSAGVETSPPSMKEVLNPSTSPLDISRADLVGLTPQHINQALTLKLKKEDLESTKLSRIADIMYKNQLIRQADRRTDIAAYKAIQEWEGKGPMNIPGIGPVSMKDWNSYPTDVKAYSYYVYDETQNNRTPLGFQEWVHDSSPATLEKIYKHGLTDKNFLKFAFEWQETGRSQINIDTKAKGAYEVDMHKNRAKFTDPAYVSNVWKRIEDPQAMEIVSATEQLIRQGVPEDKARARAKKTAIVAEMDKEIRGSYRGITIERTKEGWYSIDENGNRTLEVRNPYYAK